MKLARALVISLITAGLTLGVHQRRSSATPHCHAVTGSISSSFATAGCNSPVALCTTGVITGGVLQGTEFYTTQSLVPAATMPGDQGTFLSYAGTLVITTCRGTITLQDKGVFDDAPSGPFSEYDQVVSGTGIFAKATGTVFFNGFVKADASGLDADVTGQICGIDGDGDNGGD